MKKTLIACACVLLALALTSGKKNDGVMTVENGVYVVNTTTLCKDVVGYEGLTPLKVYIKGNKIQKVEFLPNQETPRYWKACAKHLETKWDGMAVKKVMTTKVDGRTGATFSSDAVKKNVQAAAEYYLKNK